MSTLKLSLGILGVAAGLFSSCGPVSGTGGTGTSGTSSSSSGSTAVGYTFAVTTAGDDDPYSRGGLGLAVSATGEVAIAYYVDLPNTMTWVCTTPFDTKDVPYTRLRLTRSTGTTFTTTTVEDVRSEEGVSLAFNSAGQLWGAYGGGEAGTGYCGASDLVVGNLDNGPGAVVATTSANGGMCRLMQNSCNSGNVVGRFPSLVFDDTDQPVVAFKDIHFGFSQETDLDGADLELMVGSMRTTVDESSGAGEFSVAFMADGRPAVAHVVTANHVFDGNVNWPAGVWLAWLQEDGTWQRDLVDSRVPRNQIGAAWHPTQGFAVAFQAPGSDEQDLIVSTSTDGLAWVADEVDFLGSVGQTPAVAFNETQLLVAYRICASPDTGNTQDCPPEEDGVRLATRQAGQWYKDLVYRNEERLEGTDIRMALTADGLPVIAFKDQGNGQVKVARGSRK